MTNDRLDDDGLYLLDGKRVSRDVFRYAIASKYGPDKFHIGDTVRRAGSAELLRVTGFDRVRKTATVVPLDQYGSDDARKADYSWDELEAVTA